MAVFWKKVHIFLDKLIKLNKMEMLLNLSSLKAKSKSIIPRTLSDLTNVTSSPFPLFYPWIMVVNNTSPILAKYYTVEQKCLLL